MPPSVTSQWCLPRPTQVVPGLGGVLEPGQSRLVGVRLTGLLGSWEPALASADASESPGPARGRAPRGRFLRAQVRGCEVPCPKGWCPISEAVPKEEKGVTAQGGGVSGVQLLLHLPL